MFTVVIPARYGSMRLPGKPLAMIADQPMIQHVYQQAQKSDAQKVIVATDDQRVADVVKDFGGEVYMTAAEHASGTDRIHEVVQMLQLSDDEIVVNVQGDEPLIPPTVINQVAENLKAHKIAAAATLSKPIDNELDYQNPNIVKVVADINGYALYFSRASIPFYRESESKPFVSLEKDSVLPQRHIGIYAYRVSLLSQFVQWPIAMLESIECLEQLRILSNGQKIHISEAVEAVPGGIDTPEDLARLDALLKQVNA